MDEIPSPYLTGILDKFFDGKLRPFIETNRGCPFTCSFCHTGDYYYHKLNKFSEDRVKAEIEYIAKRVGKLGITSLHFADVNFGMYPQDNTTCKFLVDSKKKYGWPQQIQATTGKNNKHRVINITDIVEKHVFSSTFGCGCYSFKNVNGVLNASKIQKNGPKLTILRLQNSSLKGCQPLTPLEDIKNWNHIYIYMTTH